jgi:phosphate-selective porin OprO/OprP
MSKRLGWIAAFAVLAWTALPLFADTAQEVQELKQMVREQGRELQQLKARMGAVQSTTADQVRAVMNEMGTNAHNGNDFVAYWNNGVRLKTLDGSVKIKLGARYLGEAVWAPCDEDDELEEFWDEDFEDCVATRRVSFYMAGNITQCMEFMVEVDLAPEEPSLLDAYLRWTDIPVVGNVMVGHFKEPFSLEKLTRLENVTFMERSMAVEAFSPGRNYGIMAHNHIGERFTWATGLFKAYGDEDGDLYDENNRNECADGLLFWTSRVTWLPWYDNDGRHLLHLGLAYSLRHYDTGNDDGDVRLQFRAKPEFHNLPRLIETGGNPGDLGWFADWAHLFGAEVAWVHGPFSVQGEYIGACVEQGIDDLGDYCFGGGYINASWFMTGESRPYDTQRGVFTRVIPHKNWCEPGGWGAWELAARYSCVDLLDEGGALLDEGGRMQSFTLGLNWYLNPNMRVAWNWIHNWYHHEAGADIDTDMFGMRVQVDF